MMKLNQIKKSRRVATFILASLVSVCSYGQSPVRAVVTDQLQPAEAVTMSGYLGQKLDASYEHRILDQDVNRLVAPFTKKNEESCWQSEFWGKWFTSAVQAYHYRPEPKLKAVLDDAVAKLISTQTPDGYIGNYAPDHRLEAWDIWGRKYCMLGLLAYYDLTKDEKSLLAARREADFLMRELDQKNVKIVTKGNHRGMAATSVLEPIVLLYARTADKKYLTFAQEIVSEWESPAGPQLISRAGTPVGERFPIPQKNWFGYEQGQKAYEMMSCYEGLLELYRLTGKPEYRTAVEKTWESIRDTEINVAGSGSSIECWFGGKATQALPAKRYQETCVTATWIKLSQQLLRLTGEAKYAEAIEQTLYNALLSSMKADGSTWAKYTPLAGLRNEGDEQCGMGLNCCVASGPRGLFTIPPSVVMTGSKGITVNFFSEGSYQAKTPAGQPLTLNEQTDYPLSGKINMKMDLSKAETFAVRVRIPAWSKQTTLTVNRKAVAGIKAGDYAVVSRNWQKGDEITLTLDMRGRIERTGKQPEFVAVLRGPVLLARDNRLANGVDVDEIVAPVLDKDGFLTLEVVKPTSPDILLEVKAPFMVGTFRETSLEPVMLSFCDYISAGNTYEADSRFRVWLQQLIDPARPGSVPAQAKPTE